MQVICVNSLFSSEAMEYYNKYGVVIPKQDIVFTVREIIRNADKIDTLDNVGFLLEEIVNPKVPCPHTVLGIINIEPNFSVKRFRNLDLSEISAEEVRNEGRLIWAEQTLNTKL